MDQPDRPRQHDLDAARPCRALCPADRLDRCAKAAAAADAVILDLEDGVAAVDKLAARHSLQQTQLDPATTLVRVNPSGTEQQVLDLKALAATNYQVVMLARTESAEQVVALPSWHVVALIETPAGVLAVNDIAAAGLVAIMWGAEIWPQALAAGRVVGGTVGAAMSRGMRGRQCW